MSQSTVPPGACALGTLVLAVMVAPGAPAMNKSELVDHIAKKASVVIEERDGGGVNPSGGQRGTGCSSSSSSHAAAARRAAEALVDGALLTEEVRKIAITSAVLLKMISWVDSWCRLKLTH